MPGTDLVRHRVLNGDPVEDDLRKLSIDELKAIAPAGEEIVNKFAELTHMVLVKNTAYGDSVLNPIQVWARSSATEQICVRLDDKLSRVVRGKDLDGEDIEADQVGYLVLKMILRDRAKAIKQYEDSKWASQMKKKISPRLSRLLKTFRRASQWVWTRRG